MYQQGLKRKSFEISKMLMFFTGTENSKPTNFRLKYIQKRKQEEFKNSLFINMVNIKYSSKVQTQNKNIENMNFIPCQHFEKFCRILISPIYTSVYLYTGMSCCNVRWKMASHLQQCSSIPVQFNTFDFVVSNFHHK
jgi:hypothetical protein